MNEVLVNLIAAIIISAIILFLYDYSKWTSVSLLYQKFRMKKKEERESIYITSQFFREVMKDYEAREENSLSWLRRRIIDSNNKGEYYFMMMFGSSVYLLFFLLLYIDVYAFMPMIIIPISAGLANVYLKKDLNAFWGTQLYIFRGVGVFIIWIFILNIINNPDTQLIERTISDNSWFISIAESSFAFAIGLFIVLSLIPVLKKYKAVEIELCEKLKNSICDRNIHSPSRLYRTEEFSQIYEEYSNAKTASRGIYFLTGLLSAYCFLGVTCLYVLRLDVDPSNSNSILQDTQLLDIFAFLILLTVLLITIFVYNEQRAPNSSDNYDEE